MLGAELKNNGECVFRVWSPEKETMQLQFVDRDDELIEMKKDRSGYFSVTVPGIREGERYFFLPGKKPLPDVASQWQPEGVHGPSAVVDHHRFTWHDETWKGMPFHEMIIYEIHVGTFTPEGSFEAIIPRLDDLVDTGINAIEIMPVAQFPGNRNWGYDGVFPYAVQNSYGGHEGLKKLVDACHQKGIAVILDVVYNHLGPEGNYLSQYGPYFTDHYHTPWGDAINFDGAWSDGVRDYFSNNAIYWFDKFHIDGLRLDAIHTIFDFGAVHFWELLRKKQKQFEQHTGRHRYLIAESDLNDPRVIKPIGAGGYGFDAQWLDDFHHALYVLTDENGKDRYTDFGRWEQMVKAYTDGFVHSGEFVKFRQKKYGASSAGFSGDKFVVFNQNHDQVGNREHGERLSVLVDADKIKVASAALLLSPYIPMLFMGEEYGEDNPFCYFISHSDKDLIKAVRHGRKEEFSRFNWSADPPDPQTEETFTQSRLDWSKREQGKYAIMHRWHKTLIRLRKKHPALQSFNKDHLHAGVIENNGFFLHRSNEERSQHILCLFNMSADMVSYTLPLAYTDWQTVLDSTDAEWQEEQKEKPGYPAPEQGRINLPPWSVKVLQSLDVEAIETGGEMETSDKN